MTELLDVVTEDRLGIITLNRPQAINALNGEMIRAITETLEHWRETDAVTTVLFEGNGPRGFCSGGDVRSIRELVLAGRWAEAEAFFADEYYMNGLIATFPKPIVALTHGVVMGGGIGIAGHCAFRITSTESRFAMPESAIGFVVDTGVNAILAKAPEHRALLFALCGVPVGAADALALGLTDCVVAADRRAAIRDGLVLAAEAPKVETAIVALMQAESIEAGEPTLCHLADSLAPVLAAKDAATIVDGLAGVAVDGPAASLLATLRTRSPTSLEAIVRSHRHARRSPDVHAVLERDLALARMLIAQPDFTEGVRAVLVDKDFAPRWQPQDFVGIRTDLLAAALSGGK